VGLAPIYQVLALACYRWAIRQIDPLHPDVPEIVRRIHDLEHSHAP
jgi:hypothetical protein